MLNVIVLLIALMLADYASSAPLEPKQNMSLAPYLNKRYKLTSSDDQFEEVMKALGVGAIKRKLARIASPVMMLSEKDGEYTLSNESMLRNIYVRFRLGEEFQETTPDDRVVRTVFTAEGNKLIQVQKGQGKTTRVVREFADDRVKVTVEVDGIVSVRIYEAVK